MVNRNRSWCNDPYYSAAYWGTITSTIYVLLVHLLFWNDKTVN
jgi:hypothetical protein